MSDDGTQETPNYFTNIINGYPAIDFDSTNDEYLSVEDPNDGINPGTGTNPGIFKTNSFDNVYFFSVSTELTDDNNTLFDENVSGSEEVAFFPYHDSGTDQHFWYAQNSNLSTTYSAAELGTPHILSGTSVSSPAQSQSIRRDGEQVAVDATASSFTGIDSEFNIGVEQGSLLNYLDGKVAELIVYAGSNEQQGTDIQQIESYLAIKYGLTLNQSVAAQSYLDSAGNEVFDADGDLDSYDNDIVGIGTDDGSGLAQTQSTSENTDAIVTLSNASSQESGDFLVIGNDDDNNSTVEEIATEIDAAYDSRLDREWRIDETNDIGTLDFSVDLTGFFAPGLRVVMLVDDDSDFSADITQTIETTSWDGTTAIFTGVDLTDLDHFTFAAVQTAPGGVSAGLEFWVNAGSGVYEDADVSGGSTDAAEDGDVVEAWHDLSGQGNHADEANGGNPVYVSDSINSNSAIDFDGNDYLSWNESNVPWFEGDSEISIFTVFESDNTTNRGFLDTDTGADSSEQLFISQENSGNGYTIGANGTGGPNSFDGGTTLKTLDPAFVGFTYDGAQSAVNDIYDAYFNGSEYAVTGTNTANGGISTDVDAFRIGNGESGATPNNWDGRIAEMLTYDRVLSATELNRLQSYLSVKYGITKDLGVSDYVSSTGAASVWWSAGDNAGFGNDIAGIAADAASGLDQTQSKSVNADAVVTISGATDLDDKEALVWGNNNDVGSTTVGAIELQATEVPTGLDQRTDREWKVDENNGDVGTVTVSVDLSGLAVAGSSRVNLLVDDDSDFSADLTQTIAATSFSGGVATFTVDFADGEFFTLGINILDTDGDGVADKDDLDDDNDGLLDTEEQPGDIVFFNTTDIYTYEGEGDGTFNNTAIMAGATTVDAGVQGLEHNLSGDVNGDGLEDIIWMLEDGVAQDFDTSTYINNGDGTFQAKVSQTDIASSSPYQIGQSDDENTFFGDVNGDGLADIVFMWVETGTSEGINVYLGNGDGTYQAEITSQTSGIIAAGGNYAVATESNIAGDFNGDGLMDLMYGVEGTGNFDIYLSNGDGTYANVITTTGISGFNVGQDLNEATLALDYDGDGDDDIVHVQAGANIKTWASNGDGTFVTTVITDSTDVSDSGFGIAEYAGAFDTNGDGYEDHVWAIENDGVNAETIVHQGDGSGGYGQTVEEFSGTRNFGIGANEMTFFGNFTERDTDNDGIPNHRDLDSDGDGIPDNIEAQSTAGYTAPADAFNGQGVDTAYAPAIDPANQTVSGADDYLSTDSDGDGNSDYAEAQTGVSGTDADMDGLDDIVDTDPANFGPVNAGITAPLTTYEDNGVDVWWRAAAAPGGISTDLEWWVKADIGLTPASGLVTSWEDQAGSRDSLSIVGDPQVVENSLNFNPSIDFDGTDDAVRFDQTGLPSGTTFNVEMFSVFDEDDLAALDAALTYGQESQPNFLEIGILAGSFFADDGSGDLQMFAGSTINGQPHLVNASFINNDSSLYADGELLVNDTDGATDIILNGGQFLTVGARPNGGNDFDGRISESFIYTTKLSDTERQRVDSYLALKYGITLDNTDGAAGVEEGDYVTSDGTVVWDGDIAGANTAYHNDVAVIGADLGSGLEQLKSKSVNDDSIVTISAASADHDNFAVWGNDDGTVGVWETTILQVISKN